MHEAGLFYKYSSAQASQPTKPVPTVMGSGFREGTSSRYLDLTRKREKESTNVLWHIICGVLKDSFPTKDHQVLKSET